MTLDRLEVGLSIIHIALLLYLLHRERLWHQHIHQHTKRKKNNKRLPPEGLVRATRNAITGPKGAVLRTPDEEDDEIEKKRTKRLFLAKAEKNPLTPLPDGLNPADFGIDEYDQLR